MRPIGLLLLLLFPWAVRAGVPHASFTQNKGQWPGEVLYRVLLPNGALYVEREAFTYVLQTGGPRHAHGGVAHLDPPTPYRAHAFRMDFVGGHAQATTGDARRSHYENFFLGNDPTSWGTGCAVFGTVTLEDVWPGIDLRLDGSTGLKYELLLAPFADPADIRFRYVGHDAIRLEEGGLVVTTSVGHVAESAPRTFQTVGGNEYPVPSHFELEGNEVSFTLPDGYDPALPLVIDPTLAFASFSGSTADNFGFTATYDDAGHLYGGGMCFGIGYPVTPGVQDASFNGGQTDVAVSKWSVDGSSLIWSTYLGGSRSEAPHSMVVNAQNELFIFGHTGSANMPTTPGCFDDSFAGGPALGSISGIGTSYSEGTDMFIAHLNATATSLIGCTYIGGDDNDGLNLDQTLAHNYGDPFRGEIIIDAVGDPVVASTTSSLGLPVPGASQPGYGGGTQDGYCFRMDPGLTNVLWATYIGGGGADAAYGTQVDGNGELYVAGGSTSPDLPMAGQPLQASLTGGADGFVMRYAPNGTLLGSTFLGTTEYDQCYFVQLNTENEVYVVGQTHGDYPVSADKYQVAGSSQFMHKLDHTLGTSEWSTVFGNGNIQQDLSPTAFLVSNCGQIYFSGWGGGVNSLVGNTLSTTTGLEVTADAFQSTTDGRDLYLMLLEPDATGLQYATFFGGSIGNSSGEHVDGGTSRFDKNGTIYQAVCAGCSNNDDFPTTPQAWSTTNNSPNCNLGVMKFDLTQATASITIDGPNTVCFPATVQFANMSSGGDTYLWSFGDGGTSEEFAPAHVYTAPGEFAVSMILTDSYGCSIGDTTDIQVVALTVPSLVQPPTAMICPGDSIQPTIAEGTHWAWWPSIGVSDTTLADPIIYPPTPMTYHVIVANMCGADTMDVTIDWIVPEGSAGNDVAVCEGGSVQVQGSGGGTYAWSPPELFSDPGTQSPMVTPPDTTDLSVIITTPDGCLVHDTVRVFTYTQPPLPVLRDTILCPGASVQLIADAAFSYTWTPAPGLAVLNERAPVVTPQQSTWYVVDLDNGCGTLTDSAFIAVVVPYARAWPDTATCVHTPVPLGASPGLSYLWSPASVLNDPHLPDPIATVDATTVLSVVVTDANGCSAHASVTITALPLPSVYAGPDRVAEFGERVQLSAMGHGIFAWDPPDAVDSATAQHPEAILLKTTTFTVTVTDTHGCTAADALTIVVPGTLYVPNSFSPNGDGHNDTFGASGMDMNDVELLIYNRWGELIWTTNQLNGRWDGTVNGRDSPIDTYVWKIRATEIDGRQHSLVGHVNLLR